MSKHRIKITTRAGVSVHLEVGYDRPLDEFFATIYDANMHMIAASTAIAEDKTSDWLVAYLAEHGLVMPLALINHLEQECMNLWVTNRIEDHIDYEVTAFDGTLLKLGFVQMMTDAFPRNSKAKWVWAPKEPDAFSYLNVANQDTELYFPVDLIDDQLLREQLQLDTGAEEAAGEVFERLVEYLVPNMQRMVQKLFQKEGQPYEDVLKEVLGFTPCSVNCTPQDPVQGDIDEVAADVRERASSYQFTIAADNVDGLIQESSDLLGIGLTDVQKQEVKRVLLNN